MVNILKNKWLYYAMTVLIAAGAAFESAWLFLWLVALIAFGYYKRLPFVHLIALAIVCGAMYGYTLWQMGKLSEPLTAPTMLCWTSEYTVDGASLRGFMKDEKGRKIYVHYTFRSEQEKRYYNEQSLAGRRFFVEGQLVLPEMPAHAYSFAMAHYLKSKHTLGVLEISSWRFIDVQHSFTSLLAQQRFGILRHIEKTFPPSLVTEAQALLIGSQEQVDADLTRAYQKLGITHLFAISGLHVALISMLFFEVLLRLHVRKELATVLLLIILPAYALLAGGAPSVWRAVLVVEVVMLARYLKWQLSALDALSICFILFLIWQPAVFYQIGFQLSFLATLSLILSSKLLASMQGVLMQTLMMTGVCQVLVYPLLLLHFYEMSLSSFLANVLFVPLFSFVILPLNIVFLILTYVLQPLASLLFFLYEPCRNLLTEGIFFVQSMPYQMWVAGKPSMIVVVLLFCSACLTLYYFQLQRWRLALFVLIVPALIAQLLPYTNKQLLVSFVDVGQGDCIVIELPYRRAVYVIDTGGLLRFEQEAWKQRHTEYEVGRQVVVPFLKGKGIGKVDKLILTHADADHVEGAEELLREIIVREVHVSPRSLEKSVMGDFLQEAASKRLVIREQMAGDAWQAGKAQFRYLWPKDVAYEGNNDSLVLLMQFDELKILLTGDLEREGELALVQTAYEEIRDVSILKLGHHGSKTSSIDEFIEVTNPQLAIIMAGKNNRYNHPHPEVTARLQSHQIAYLVTGEVGTITIQWDGNQLTYTHFKE
ncbi:DNA internalization-related competence protein ComEC/Rec2 [Metasolibacillus meyeri]|uniref:DNA internalization-related competence protein ComEC/Rec2 n=1 Tax=Metasolibacillus meyeri TaxID=1071052 RepID=A0AAW9NQP8_9BACL|nr:DNA internalization-related competence protein ComEC/Rec2 [Metasolibacillus meyeri]MEC1179867.1 DNA internalization-related competence protein ComEC/Rec2 [Metasolibacillus meyeri]